MSILLSFDWALFFFWLVATTVGWLFGGLIFPGLSPVANGLGAALFQAAVLAGHIQRPWRWPVVSIAGWLVGLLVVAVALPASFRILQGALFGLTVGAAQWLILRGMISWAGWWVVFSMIGWLTGLTLLPGFTLTPMLAGMLTGIPLVLLLRFPKPPAASPG